MRADWETAKLIISDMGFLLVLRRMLWYDVLVAPTCDCTHSFVHSAFLNVFLPFPLPAALAAAAAVVILRIAHTWVQLSHT